MTWPVTLTSSAPIVSTRTGDELIVQVGFEPGSREFVVASREGARIHPIFVGPSLTLACSSANQALQALAPLETLVRSREDDLYWRTRPQYLQEVHFSDALGALCELAGQDQHLGLGVVATVASDELVGRPSGEGAGCVLQRHRPRPRAREGRRPRG